MPGSCMQLCGPHARHASSSRWHSRSPHSNARSLPPRPLSLPQKAMFKGYTAPALPKAAYVHGVDDKGHQGALARESRRIVLRCALSRLLRFASRLDPRLKKEAVQAAMTAHDLILLLALSYPRRWLDSANPPISGPVALTVLDAER